jgi:uncharacterized coiled-coil protein SlyX
MSETITLEFLAAQQRRILDEIASMRDDIKVLTAIVLRHEETLIRVLEQMTAMVAQNARIVDRLRALDERVTQLEKP